MNKSEYINRVLLIMNEAGLFDREGNSFIGADVAQIDRFIEGSFVDAWRRCAQVMPKAWFKNQSFRNAILKQYLSDGTGYVVLPDDFYMLTCFKMSGWKKPVLDAYILNERTSSIQSNAYTRGSQVRPVAVIEPVAAIDYIATPTPIHFYQNTSPMFPVGGQNWYNPDTKELKEYNSYARMWADWDWAVIVDVLRNGNTYYKVSKIETVEGIKQVTLDVYDPYNDIKQALKYYSLRKGLESHTIEEAIYVPVAQPLSVIDDDTELEIDHRLLEPMAYLSASSVFTIFEKYDIAKALEQRVIEMFPAFRSVKGSNITFKQ